MSTELIAATIGGLIGIAGSSLAFVWSFFYDKYRAALESHDRYHSWLNGLGYECDHALATINELVPSLECNRQGDRRLLLKHLNTDFLAQARTAVLEHERSQGLFPTLTAAYRNIAHCNEMLDRWERAIMVLSTPKQQSNLPGFTNLDPLADSTLASFVATRETINQLKQIIALQQNIMARTQPRFLRRRCEF